LLAAPSEDEAYHKRSNCDCGRAHWTVLQFFFKIRFRPSAVRSRRTRAMGFRRKVLNGRYCFVWPHWFAPRRFANQQPVLRHFMRLPLQLRAASAAVHACDAAMERHLLKWSVQLMAKAGLSPTKRSNKIAEIKSAFCMRGDRVKVTTCNYVGS
jgi:hypothetical protein